MGSGRFRQSNFREGEGWAIGPAKIEAALPAEEAPKKFVADPIT